MKKIIDFTADGWVMLFYESTTFAIDPKNFFLMTLGNSKHVDFQSGAHKPSIIGRISGEWLCRHEDYFYGQWTPMNMDLAPLLNQIFADYGPSDINDLPPRFEAIKGVGASFSEGVG